MRIVPLVLLALAAANSLHAVYADAQYTNDGAPFGYWITKVEFEAQNEIVLTNESSYTAAPYNTYYNTLLPAALDDSGVNRVVVTFGFGSNRMGCGVWIDFNNNDSFEDAGEFVCWSNSNAVQPGPVTMTFWGNGATGVHRARIRSAYCTTQFAVGPPIGRPDHSVNAWTYGEAEDYDVDFGFGIAAQSPLPPATVGISYIAHLYSINGVWPFTWQGSPTYIVGGALPPGIPAYDRASDLLLYGTPTAAGTYTFTVSVTDSTAATATKQFQLTVLPAPLAFPFSDDFSTDKGWQLQGPWARGGATGFSQASPPCSEPGTDHTAATSDNMILGDTIGGTYAPNDTNMYWATSPKIGAGYANGVKISYWRWLGLENGSRAMMQVGVEGYFWYTIWSSTSGTIYGGATTPVWTLETFDLPGYANTMLQIRFGIGQTGATASTGWCIDDLLIEDTLFVREDGATGALIYNDQPIGGGRALGPVLANQQSAPLTIHITNNAAADISFGTITVSGAQPADFSINSTAMQNPLPFGASTTFTITFLRATPGFSAATISLPLMPSGAGSSPFDINVQGEAVSPQPLMSLEYAGLVVADGSFKAVGGLAAAPLVFTIRNTGTADLNLTGAPMVQLSAAFACTPVVTAQPASAPITPGATATFSVDVAAGGSANWNFQISIDNDDPLRNPYEVIILGQGPASGPGNGDEDEDDPQSCSSGAGQGIQLPLMLLLASIAVIWRRQRRAHRGDRIQVCQIRTKATLRVLILPLLMLACPCAFAQGLSVTPVAGGPVFVPYSGGGSEFAMGAFDVENPTASGLVLHDITISVFGTVDDSAAFAEFGLFTDSNSNGIYDPDVDTRYGLMSAGVPVDNGAMTFSSTVSIAPGSSKRFMIVAKLSGAGVSGHNASCATIVSSISGTGGAPSGLPTSGIYGFYTIGGPTPLRLEYEVTGSAPPYDYTFRLVLDNHDNSWVAGDTWRGFMFGQAAVSAVGTTPFLTWVTDAASYPVGPFNSTSWVTFILLGHYDAPSIQSNPGWTPTSVGDQLTWWGTADVFLEDGEMTWSDLGRTGSSTNRALLEPAHRVGDYLRVDAVPAAAMRVAPTETGSGNGFAVGAFEITSHTNSSTLTDITIAASGTGDDSTAFSDIRLFVDVNGNAAYDAGIDSQFGQSYTAYPIDDGSLTFAGSLNFNPNETKQLLVVARLNGSTLASYGQTFDTTVTAINATGNMHLGLPTASMPGVHIAAPTITQFEIGAARPVQANAQGPGGIGLRLVDFLLTNNAVGSASLDSITISAAGALYDQADFSFVALYRDTNLSGDLDFGDAAYGTAASNFPNDDGALTFSQAITFAPGQARLFFLVGKLSGTAQVGADFYASITALGVSGGTEVSGVPGELVQGLVVVSPAPELAILRASPIANGGSDALGDGPPGAVHTVTYTIENTGPLTLTLTGTPSLTTGANLSFLGVSSPPSLVINAGSSTSFTVEYVVAAEGAFDFTVSIDSNDPVNNPYIWSVTGTGSVTSKGGSSGDDDEKESCSSGTRTSPVVPATLLAACMILCRRRRPRLSE